MWAVGQSFNGSIDVPITMHWNGTSWSLVSVPNPSANGSDLVSVKALGSGDVWAFGTQRSDAFGHSAPLIEHWDGTAWSVVPDSPDTPLAGDDGFLTGSAFTSGHVLAVGYTEPQNTSAGSTASQELCPLQVTDGGYQATVRLPMGTDARWSVLASDTGNHSITDGHPTGLFDSGSLTPGGSFDFQFNAASNYYISDTATGDRGGVVVPMTVAPSSGATTTTFTLQWATAPPPSGYVYDVQIKRPGDTKFSNWMLSQTGTGTNFHPDDGGGTYTFHVRVRRLSGGYVDYSPAATITVS